MTKENLFKAALDSIVGKSKEKRKAINSVIPSDLKHIGLIGCGGTVAQLYPLQYFLDRYGSGFVTTVHNGAEFADRHLSYIGSGSLIVASSHSGGTQETVRAIQFAKKNGAKVISITADKSSALAKISDLCLDYDDGPSLSEAKLMLTYLVGIEVVGKNHSVIDHDKLLVSWASLPDAFLATMEQLATRAEEYARTIKDEKLFYVLGTGGAYGAAYAFCICKLMEMQWRHGVPLNAAEFFHGPLEAADHHIPFLVLMSEDNMRPHAERVIRFLEKHTSKLHVIDTSIIELPDFPTLYREVFSALLLWPAINTYSEKISVETGHPLTKRRYMGVVEY